MNANAFVTASGALALWIFAASAGCSSEPPAEDYSSTPTAATGTTTNTSGTPTSGAVGSTTGTGGATSTSAVATPTAGSTTDTSSSGLGGVSAVSSTASVTSSGAGGATTTTTTVSSGGATADSTSATTDATSTTGGDATLTDDQCSGISNGSECATEGVCAPRACGLADTGTRTCTCAGGLWDCTSCAWTEPYDAVAEPPTEPLPACTDQADDVPCETSGDRCDAGDEVCACWIEEADGLIWDCDSPPSFWD